MKINKKIIIPVILLGIAAGLLSAGLLFVRISGSKEDNKPGEKAAVSPVAVRVQMPVKRTLEHRLSYAGTVYVGREVRIISQVQGAVTELPFNEGESFPEGAVLARLDSPEIEASVERLESEHDYWQSRYETDKRLAAQNALAPEQVESSSRALRSARAGLAEARAGLEKTVLTARFSGQILDRYVEPGQVMMPGQPILLIGDSSREVRVDVVEEDLARGVAAGIPVELKPGASSVIESRVSSISSVSSGKARSFTVTVSVPQDAGGQLRKGASIRADFVLNRKENATAVPVRAVADRDNNPYIFIISVNHARKVRVKTGISEGGWIAADFSWNGTDPVAVTNLRSLIDGVPVYPVAEEGSR